MAQPRDKSRQVIEPANTPAALPAPRFAFGWASLVYALCTFSLAYPALAGQFLVNPHSDQYIAGYAFREFAASTLRATGQFPLWNPYLFGGMPYIAAMHGDIFYPTFLLRMVLPTDVAMTWGFIIHVFLCRTFHVRVPARVRVQLLRLADRRNRVHDGRTDRVVRVTRSRREAVRQRAVSAGSVDALSGDSRREELELGRASL